jgi:hypothetical protein
MGSRVSRNTHAPCTLCGSDSTTGHCDQSAIHPLYARPAPLDGAVGAYLQKWVTRYCPRSLTQRGRKAAQARSGRHRQPPPGLESAGACLLPGDTRPDPPWRWRSFAGRRANRSPE